MAGVWQKLCAQIFIRRFTRPRCLQFRFPGSIREEFPMPNPLFVIALPNDVRRMIPLARPLCKPYSAFYSSRILKPMPS